MRITWCNIGVALCLLLAVHGHMSTEESEVQVLSWDDEAVSYAGPNGFARSEVMPANTQVLRSFQSTKTQCAAACKTDTGCVGFKYAEGSCSLMKKGAPKPLAKPKTAPVKWPKPPKNVRGPGTTKKSRKALKKAEKELAKNSGAMTVTKASLQAVEKRAEKHVSAQMKMTTAQRNKRRFRKRARRQMARYFALKTKIKYAQAAKKSLFAKTKKSLKKKLANLPAKTRAGSQKRVQNHFIREQYRRYKRRTKRDIRRQKRKGFDGIARAKFKLLVDKSGPKLAEKFIRKMMKKEKMKYTEVRKGMRPSDFPPPSSTASKYADNIKRCAKLKPLCKKMKKIQKQCPATCAFVITAEKKNEKQVKKAQKKVIKQKKDQRKALHKKLEKERRIQDAKQEEVALAKEKRLKLDIKKKKILKTLKPKPVFKVEVHDPAHEKLQKARDKKALQLMTKGQSIAGKGKHLVKAGKKLMSKGKKKLKKVEKLISKSKQKSKAVVLSKKTGLIKVTKPDPAAAAKAKKNSIKVKNEMAAGKTDVKKGKKDLLKARKILKRAIAVGKGRASLHSKPDKPHFSKSKAKHIEKMAKSESKKKHAKALRKLKEKQQKAAAKLKKKTGKKKRGKKRGKIKRKLAAMKKRVRKQKRKKKESTLVNSMVPPQPPQTKLQKKANKLIKSMKPKKRMVKKQMKKAKKATKKDARKLKKKMAGAKKDVKKMEAKEATKAKATKAAKKDVQSTTKKPEVRLSEGLKEAEKLFKYENGKCEYNPPAGCGCSSTVLPQQTQPRLGEAADPTSTNDCPAMPGGCACRVAHEELAELGEGDDADMFSGIICRVRTALHIGKVHHPHMLAKFEHSKSFIKRKSEIQPLLDCVKDSKKSDSDCAVLVPQLFDSLGAMLPKLKNLQQSIGSEYKKAVAHRCK